MHVAKGQCQPETQYSQGNGAETHLGHYSSLNPSAHFYFTLTQFIQMLLLCCCLLTQVHKIYAKPVNL